MRRAMITAGRSEPSRSTDKAHSQGSSAVASCIPPGTTQDWQRSRQRTVLVRLQHSTDSSCREIPCLAGRLRASKLSSSRTPLEPAVPEIYRPSRHERPQEASEKVLRLEHYMEPQPEYLLIPACEFPPFWLPKPLGLLTNLSPVPRSFRLPQAIRSGFQCVRQP